MNALSRSILSMGRSPGSPKKSENKEKESRSEDKVKFKNNVVDKVIKKRGMVLGKYKIADKYKKKDDITVASDIELS